MIDIEKPATKNSKSGNMIRRSLELKKAPKHLSICTQCYQFIHDIPGESSAFIFEHMCDGTTKDFVMLQKAKSILQSLPVKETKEIEMDEDKGTEVVETTEETEAAEAAKEIEAPERAKGIEVAEEDKVEEA